eukprot:g20575.t1
MLRSAGTFEFFLLAVSAVLVTLNLVKELQLMQGMFLLGKLRQYWFTVGNYLDWCRLCLSYAVLGMLAFDWAIPSTDMSILLAITVLFRWGDVLTTFRGYQWVGEKVLPIERALLSSRTFAAIVWVACCAFTNSYVALGLSSGGSERLFHSFFDPKKDLAAALGIITSLCMTVVMMNIFIGVLSESYSQAYRNRHLSFQRERKRAYDAWRLTCCCRKEKAETNSKYLWYSVKQRMSSILKTLLRKEGPSPVSMSEDSSPVKPRRLKPQLPRVASNQSAHAAPPVASVASGPAFQSVLPEPQLLRGRVAESENVVNDLCGDLLVSTGPNGEYLLDMCIQRAAVCLDNPEAQHVGCCCSTIPLGGTFGITGETGTPPQNSTGRRLQTAGGPVDVCAEAEVVFKDDKSQRYAELQSTAEGNQLLQAHLSALATAYPDFYSESNCRSSRQGLLPRLGSCEMIQFRRLDAAEQEPEVQEGGGGGAGEPLERILASSV